MSCESDGRLKRGRARRELLLDAAVAVIASGGARQLTHRAVASQAGVSLASVTYHFPSIADLRSAAFGHAGSRVGFAFRGLFEANRDDLSRVPQLAAAHVASLVGPGRQDTVAVFEMILAANHDDALKPVIRELEGHLADLLTPYVGDRSIALTVGSSIQGLILSHLARGDSTDTGSLHDAVAELVGRYGAKHHH
jgi:DNA-binding transcriptional regulator YbjK